MLHESDLLSLMQVTIFVERHFNYEIFIQKFLIVVTVILKLNFKKISSGIVLLKVILNEYTFFIRTFFQPSTEAFLTFSRFQYQNFLNIVCAKILSLNVCPYVGFMMGTPDIRQREKIREAP